MVLKQWVQNNGSKIMEVQEIQNNSRTMGLKQWKKQDRNKGIFVRNNGTTMGLKQWQNNRSKTMADQNYGRIKGLKQWQKWF